MVPETPVLVVGHDDRDHGPQWAPADAFEDVSNVLVPGEHVGVAGVLVQVTGRFVERHLRQRAGVERLHEVLAVLQVLVAVGGPWCEPHEVVERLMVRLEVDGPRLERVDHAARDVRGLHPVGKRPLPRACVPCPRDALGRERVANRLRGLRRQRMA